MITTPKPGPCRLVADADRTYAVLWQNEHFPEVARGGGGAVNTKYICRALAEAGHRPVIVARAVPPRSAGTEIAEGLMVVRLEAPRPSRILWPLWPLLEARPLRRLLAPLAALSDVLCAVDASYANALKGMFPERPLLYRVEGLPSEGARAPEALTRAGRAALRVLALAAQLAERLAWRRADVLVVKSAFMRDALVQEHRAPAEKILVIPNGVDFDRFAHAETSTALRAWTAADGQPHIVIAFSGRLVAMKNVSGLLRAFALMRNRERVRLLVVGDGDQRPALEEQARALGVAARCFFTGLTDRVEQFLAAADIFVLPSTYEPFGNALVEAMAAGVAPVAFRPDGHRIRTASAEIIRDGETGILADHPSPDNLARVLDELVQNPDLRRRLGRRAQEDCRNRFSWKKCAEAYIEAAAAVQRR
ncbi:MAG TPA: glycosyltransferase family 4 protein [Dehalococcoidia bacterium]|nr:glycosyltransferase family 4 protein [Dehalococcoidia bacterium]